MDRHGAFLELDDRMAEFRLAANPHPPLSEHESDDSLRRGKTQAPPSEGEIQSVCL